MSFENWAIHMVQWFIQTEDKIHNLSNLKTNLSSNYSLKSGYMKVEQPVIVYHYKTVNILIRVQTARQAFKIGMYGTSRDLI